MRTMCRLLLLLVIFSQIISLPAVADVLVYPMGPATAAPLPGAIRITPADARWQHPQDLTAVDNPATGFPIWTNPFTEAAIVSHHANTLRFPAAPGVWQVYLRAGIGADRGTHSCQVFDFDAIVNDKTVTFRFPAPDSHGPYYTMERTCTVVSTGELAVTLNPRTAWCLEGLVAWPIAESARAQAMLAPIQAWCPPEEMARWSSDPPPDAGPAPRLSPADQARGFYLWSRQWAYQVYPDTNPTSAELNPHLRLCASPGEYGTVSLVIHPLRTLQAAQVSVDALGPIPAANIEIHKVRYMTERSSMDDQQHCRVVPDILDPWQDGPLQADRNTTVWLTIHVPDKAPPGVYQGNIHLRTDDTTTAIPVTIRILDILLRDDPAHCLGIYYTNPLEAASKAPDDISRQYWEHKAEAEFADMTAHGVRTIALHCWLTLDELDKQSAAQQRFDQLDAELTLAQRYHFLGPYLLEFDITHCYAKYLPQPPGPHLRNVAMPPDAFFTDITRLIRAIEDERLRRHWPVFLYLPIDEPGESAAAASFLLRTMQAIHAGGGKTIITASPTPEIFAPLREQVDVWNAPSIESNDPLIGTLRTQGVDIWTYPDEDTGATDHTPVAGARMAFGFAFWRSGLTRRIPWIYQWNDGDPFNYLDGQRMDFLVRSQPENGEPISVALWEAFREGYNDYRYIYTLQQAIALSKQSKQVGTRQLGETAQTTLNEIWQAIPVRPQYIDTGFWSPETMDAYRWQIAELLEQLTGALRGEGLLSTDR